MSEQKEVELPELDVTEEDRAEAFNACFRRPFIPTNELRAAYVCRERQLREALTREAALTKKLEFAQLEYKEYRDLSVDETDLLNQKHAEQIAALTKQVEEMTKRALIARRRFHNLNTCNQYFERCEHPTCNPDAPLAMLESSTFSAIPGDRVKLERIAELEAELATAKAEAEELQWFRDRVQELGFSDTDEVKHAKEDLDRLREDIIELREAEAELAALRERATVTYRTVHCGPYCSPHKSVRDAIDNHPIAAKVVEKTVITRERILDATGGEV